MSDYTLYTGDCLDVMRTLPANSVQCCVTSPPYYGLRDYGVDGQIGLEESPDAYVAKLVDVFREVRRVLHPTGTVWLNLGDSYNSGTQFNHHSNGLGDAKRYSEGERGDWSGHRAMIDGLKPKDLIGIPWAVSFALRADGWWLRSEIIWHKRAPMPESVTDRPTKAHEQVFLLTKSAKYFYDAEAIREPNVSVDENGNHVWTGKPVTQLGVAPHKELGRRYSGADIDPIKGAEGLRSMGYNLAGRNRRSVWTLGPESYSGAHFATMPTKLVEPCILAGSKVGDTVLDPFSGSGTTVAVALKHGRHGIGIDLNAAYNEMAHDRIGRTQPLLLAAD